MMITKNCITSIACAILMGCATAPPQADPIVPERTVPSEWNPDCPVDIAVLNRIARHYQDFDRVSDVYAMDRVMAEFGCEYRGEEEVPVVDANPA